MEQVDPRRLTVGVMAVCGATAVVLFAMGRGPWCSCGSPVPWSFDTWSRHNSQHLFDAYSLSHMLHGVVFYGALFLVARKLALHWRGILAAGHEALWELAENTDTVIQHYRENTVSLDYYGDSVANSMADIVCCVGGLPVRRCRACVGQRGRLRPDRVADALVDQGQPGAQRDHAGVADRSHQAVAGQLIS